MNSFGLGLVLNFIDNASSGMSSATQTFERMSVTADSMTSSVASSAQELMTIAYSLNAVGDTFISIGSSITSVFTGVTQSVIDTGMEIQGFRMQLNALYGNLAESKLEEIKDYAAKSVFEVQSLIPAVTMMKAVGIEAMDNITTSSGENTQKLLDYASDIAAMFPNMHNAYGTGVNAAMGAIKEYVAEGNARSLKSGAGINITEMLGEEKGSSIEERAQQIADIVEQLGILGYTTSLQGTPTQQLSNLQDNLFNTMSKIADSGVFESYCGLLSTLSGWIGSVVEDEEKFNVITQVVADTINTLISPLQSVLEWVIANTDALIDWIKEHPKLTKFILLTVAAIGALITVSGLLLKVLATVAFAIAGLQILKLPQLIGMVGAALSSVLPYVLLVIAVAGVLYTVWKKNLFGIRDLVTQVFSDLGSIISIVFDALWDNTLSEEDFLKAQELGILPFIETLLDAKYKIETFIQEIGDKIISLYDKVSAFVESVITIALNLWETWLKPIFDQLKQFFKEIWDSTLQPLLSKLGSFISSVVDFVFAVINAVLWLWNNILSPIVNWLVTVLAPIVNGVVQIVLGVIRHTLKVIGDVIGGIITFIQGIITFLTGVFTGDWEKAWEGIKGIFKGIWESFIGIVKGVVNSVITIVNGLISTIYSTISSVVNGIGSIVGSIGETIGVDIGFNMPGTAPQIPLLAEGGKAVKPTPAIVGDGPEDEAILPLNDNVFREIASGINRNSSTTPQQTVQNDYSVTFAAGSVVIQLNNASEAELEKAAEKIMKIIARKQQLQAMALRK